MEGKPSIEAARALLVDVDALACFFAYHTRCREKYERVHMWWKLYMLQPASLASFVARCINAPPNMWKVADPFAVSGEAITGMARQCDI